MELLKVRTIHLTRHGDDISASIERGNDRITGHGDTLLLALADLIAQVHQQDVTIRGALRRNTLQRRGKMQDRLSEMRVRQRAPRVPGRHHIPLRAVPGSPRRPACGIEPRNAKASHHHRPVHPAHRPAPDRKLPEGPHWLGELELDGYRAIAAKTNGNIHLWSQNENGFAARYPSIATARKHLPDNTVIDGEIIALSMRMASPRSTPCKTMEVLKPLVY